MKKLIFSFSVVLSVLAITHSALAKNYSIAVKSKTIIKVDSLGGTSLQLQVKNTASTVTTIKWGIITNTVAFSGWAYQFCDLNTCYTPPSIPNGGTDYLDPNSSSPYNLIINSFHKIAAKGVISVWMYDITDPTHPDTVTLTIDASRLGIENPLMPENKVSIYPNPVSNNLTLQVMESGFTPTKVSILNLDGKLISTHIIAGTSNNVNVEALPKGVYFLRMQDNSGKEAVKQFIKD